MIKPRGMSMAPVNSLVHEKPTSSDILPNDTASPSSPSDFQSSPKHGAVSNLPLRATGRSQKRVREFARISIPPYDPQVATNFIVEHLKSQVLADLKLELDRQFHGGWAFTGSVALNVHAAALDGEMARPFQDVDVLVNVTDRQVFAAKQLTDQRNPAFLNPGVESGDPTHYRFKGILVDMVDSGSMRKKVRMQSEEVCGVPVKTLKLLIDAKIAFAEPTETGALPMRAQKDLAILERLRDKKAAASNTTLPTTSPDASPFKASRRTLKF